jgi:hypothetical protein
MQGPPSARRRVGLSCGRAEDSQRSAAPNFLHTRFAGAAAAAALGSPLFPASFISLASDCARLEMKRTAAHGRSER